MSGGEFDHKQWIMIDIAQDIEEIIEKNDSEEADGWGGTIGRHYTPETIAEFKKGVDLLRKAHVYAQRIDWLLSGDDGEETFHVRLQKQLQEIENYKDN